MTATFEVAKLFNPRSIAIVGASPRENSAGGAVLRTLTTIGFTGDVYPVNPRYADVHGFPCYSSMAELPGPVDAVFIGLAAEASVAVLREAATYGVRAAEIHAGGFADGGSTGKALQRQIVRTANEYGMAVCGPNNMGLLNVHDRTGLWPLPLENLKPGPVAVISQSGSAAMILSEDPKRLGLAYIVTTGNEAVLTATDYLEFVVRDERVRLVLMFLETIRDPTRFVAAAKEAASRGTRIVALKVGKSEQAQAAIKAHTNAVAGADRVYEAFFRECGVIRVSDFDEMLETALLFSVYPEPPTTSRVIAFTMSGGEAALVGDLASSAGVSLPQLKSSTRTGLRGDLSTFSLPGNPLDMWSTGWNYERFNLALDRLLQDTSIATIVAAVDAPVSGGLDTHIAHEIARAFANAQPRTSTRFIMLNNSAAAGTDMALASLLSTAGIPCLTGMRQGLDAISHWTNYVPVTPGRRVKRLGEHRTAAVLREHVAKSSPSDVEISHLLHDAGIPMVKSHVARSANEAVRLAESLGYPVVMKGHSDRIFHKSDLGLVKLMLTNAKLVRAAFKELSEVLAAVPATRAEISIQAHERGLEMVVGVRNDPDFGLVTMTGLGGVHLEFVREVSVRVGVVDPKIAHEMFSETLAATFLRGVRGAPPYDIGAAARTVAAVWSFASSVEDHIASVEINPLLVRERGLGAVGVDAVLILSERQFRGPGLNGRRRSGKE